MTYDKTLGLLRALTHRPIFIGEVGATETGGKKVAWIDDFFKQLPLNPDIIGFAWFSLTVAGGTGETTGSNDWRINSSLEALAAFKVGIADARYGRALDAAPQGPGPARVDVRSRRGSWCWAWPPASPW